MYNIKQQMPTNNVVCFDCFCYYRFLLNGSFVNKFPSYGQMVMISFHIIMCQPHVMQLRSELLDNSDSPQACEFARETKKVPEF